MPESVRPLNPPAPYFGGKSHLAARIIARIDAIPHTSYIEPFFGMGGIFFRRSSRPKTEIINDINGELVNFFRILQRHPQELLRNLRFMLTSRELFERLQEFPRHLLTDIERAAVFYYLQRLAYGGKITAQSFGTGKENQPRFNIPKERGHLEALHGRLAWATIENMHYAELIEKYDHPRALFYLDPPYYHCEKDYGKNIFSREDFTKLAALLCKLSGAFILSLNDVPEVHEIFEGFIIERVETVYSVAMCANSKVGEVVISNHEPVQERLL